MAIRILLADDNDDFRRMARRFLESREDLEICAEATNGLEAVRLAQLTRPDIALLDISMPNGNGIDACRKIKRFRPDTLIIAMSVYQQEMFISEVVAAGFDGFVSKTSISAQLIPAIERIRRGEHWFHPARARSR